MQLTFDLETTGFSLTNARACAAAAKAAYSNAESRAVRPACLSTSVSPNVREDRQAGRLPYLEGESAFIECRATNTQALVIDCGSAIVVAFRGTQEPLDFVTDAEAWRRNITGCTVHFGFWKAMTSVFQPVCAAIRKFSVGKPLFITGHSLGGALAVLFAYRYIPHSDLSRRSFRAKGELCTPHSIYTFGQPRVGDRNFARRYDRFHGDQTFRVVNDQDLVPRVPGVLLGYRHCGNEALLSAECGMRSAELGNRSTVESPLPGPLPAPASRGEGEKGGAELPISNLKFSIPNPDSPIPHSALSRRSFRAKGELRIPHSRVFLNPGLRFKLLRDAWALWRARRAGPLALTALLRDHHLDQYLAKLGN